MATAPHTIENAGLPAGRLRQLAGCLADLAKPFPADDRITRAVQLATAHRATLGRAASLTSDTMVLRRIASVRAKVEQYAAWGDAGMLGENGLAPAVRDVAMSAAMSGMLS